VPLNGPGDGRRFARPADAAAAEDTNDAIPRRPLIGGLDGGVSRRLVRRCRTAASILLAVGAALLLVVAVAPWGVVPAVLTLAAGALLTGCVLLLRRGALWSAVARSPLPVTASGTSGVEVAGTPSPAGTANPPEAPATTASIGPPRQLSPGLAGAPVKRRLSSVVVPVHVGDGPSPGGGALIVHARADGAHLSERDTVQIWLAGTAGPTGLPAPGSGARSVRGRFVLYRADDDNVFLATTRLTDTW
jgi:hypothetical protein